ncbi:choline-binding transcriptional repressor BetI [Frigidibacter sp. ROC022]|uniref:choline-binding transcriptional repressor BetI n=1 Tax=Frigidibacter sp. ROC022 TaxID=2971796 RepID=UPI00215AF0CA|nr:transcriptional regulator BetI [Frigidibacter sp. ROC022]MCR8725827.1 transcriptional regulator BetI [Frigidibacter sp. ROC022]
MPKLGMEPIRREALVKATIAEVGRTGSLDVTVSQIARTAGMSSALAHHYFGAKEQIFDAAMRHILALYAAEVKAALAGAETPRARVEAIVRASFAPPNFQAEVVSAWLSFYVRAQMPGEARRLLRVYQRRLRSNLLFGLRPLVGAGAPAVADTLAALIDGLYIRAALGEGTPDGAAAVDCALGVLDRLLGERR